MFLAIHVGIAAQCVQVGIVGEDGSEVVIPAIAVTGHVDRLGNALLLGLLVVGLNLQYGINV